jgi:hypothetical protein
MVAMPPLRRIAEWDNALDEPGVTHLVDVDCVWMDAWTPRMLKRMVHNDCREMGLALCRGLLPWLDEM